jgi:CheY-like chemotaxis protein
MSLNPHKTETTAFGPRSVRLSHADNPVVLMVDDQEAIRSEMKHVLELNGYRVIDTDSGQDAVKRARYLYPDLLLVNLDVPLLYQMVAARQIVKNAQLGNIPVVIVAQENVVDPVAAMEIGVRRNEYLTRLSNYQQLENLLDYLLPVEPRTA